MMLVLAAGSWFWRRQKWSNFKWSNGQNGGEFGGALSITPLVIRWIVEIEFGVRRAARHRPERPGSFFCDAPDLLRFEILEDLDQVFGCSPISTL
jgi:hypothetical protein